MSEKPNLIIKVIDCLTNLLIYLFIYLLISQFVYSFIDYMHEHLITTILKTHHVV